MVHGTTYWTDLFVRHFLFQTDRNIDCDDLLFFVRKKHIKSSSRILPKFEVSVGRMFHSCLFFCEGISFGFFTGFVYVLDWSWCVQKSKSKTAHWRPRYGLGGNCVPEPNYTSIRLHINSGYLYKNQSKRTASSSKAFTGIINSSNQIWL